MDLDADAKAGKLPQVAWLFAPDGLSEHPGDLKHTGKPMVSLGMQWPAFRVHAAATGPLWVDTAIFITWDDSGGWYGLAPAWRRWRSCPVRDQHRLAKQRPRKSIEPRHEGTHRGAVDAKGAAAIL